MFFNLQPKQNIMLWHLLPKRLFGYINYLWIWEFYFLILLLYIVKTRVLFRLLTTRFFMNELSILRSIVILLVIISSMAPLLFLLFLLLQIADFSDWDRLSSFSSLTRFFQIADFFTKSHFISHFCFLVGKLSMLVAVVSWVWGEMLRHIFILFYLLRV